MSNRESPRWGSNRNLDGAARSTSWHNDNRSRHSRHQNWEARSQNPSDNLTSNNWNANSRDTGWRPNQQSPRYRDDDDDMRSRSASHPNHNWSNVPNNTNSHAWNNTGPSHGSGHSLHHTRSGSNYSPSPSNSPMQPAPFNNCHQPNTSSAWNVSAESSSNWSTGSNHTSNWRSQTGPTSTSSWNTTPPKPSSSCAQNMTRSPPTSDWSSGAPPTSGWSSTSSSLPSSNWSTSQDSSSGSGWNTPAETSTTSCSGWDSAAPSLPAAATGTGWDAPIIRTASSVDDVPAKKVLTREAEMEELFGSGLHPTSSSGINFDKYDSIPVDLKGNHLIEPVQSFRHLPLHAQLLNNIERARYSRPTPIQKYSIPIISNRRDLMACAQTGSGKTAAFLVPAINAVLSGKFPKLPDSEMSRRTAYPYVVILSPTRELALQIHFEARKFCFDTDCSCVCVYGGQDLRIQARDLAYGSDIIVATPGRLTDFLEKNRISLKNVKLLIFDEADRMLDMGFEPQIRRIVEQSDMTPSSAGRQTVMFSATYPRSIQRLASQFLQDYLHLTVGRVGSTTDSIRQMLEYSEEHLKREALLKWIPKVDGLTVVFVATKRNADMIADWFRRQNISAVCIHGDRTQEQREDALQDFRSGKAKFLVATDVAARGLDIANVLWVINYDLPNTIDDYIHRIGRTGRCGNTGTALSFVNENSGIIIRHLFELLNENGQNVPGFLQKMIDDGVPEREQFRRRDGGGRSSRDRIRPAGPAAPIFRDRNAKTFEIG